MLVVMDFTTYLKARQAIEFAIDECANRAADLHEEGNHRSAQAWMLTRAEYIKTLDEFDGLPRKNLDTTGPVG